MPSMLHPYRTLEIPEIARQRGRRMDPDIETAGLRTVSNPEKENRGPLAPIAELYRSYHDTLWEAASAVVFHQPIPEIYDVSALLGKLPDQDVTMFKLSGLVVPAGDILYLSFGRQTEMLLDNARDIFIEGAYVDQLDSEDGTQSEFSLTLVCSDPEFDDANERPFMDTMRRNVMMIRMDIGALETVGSHLESVESAGDFCDPIFKENFPACLLAFDAAIKSMIYLGTPERDVEIGCGLGADPELKAKAIRGDDDALDDLIDAGYPLVKIVGRHIRRVIELEEPDYDAQHAGMAM